MDTLTREDPDGDEVCELCDRPFSNSAGEGGWCDSCGAAICSACVIPGDDVCGDECPICGGRFV